MSQIKLTDICTIQYGYAFDASLFSTSKEDGMPLIRIRDVKDGFTSTYYKGEFSDEYVVHKDDYLIGMDGEFNIEPWQSDDALLNQRVCKISAKTKDILIRYVYRFLKKELKRIEEDTPFVTVKHLSAKRLNQIQLSIPSLSEQERIVEELDCLSGVIEKKKQQLKELDALAQSIFYEMFGNPVENDRGWEVKKLGEVAIINPSKKETSKNLCDTDIVSFLPMEDLPIKACYYHPYQTRIYSEVQSSYTCFADNDVLMAKVTPCFENGKVGIASNLTNGVGYGSSEFIVIRTNNIEVIKEYIYFFIQDKLFIENASAQLTGTSGLRRVPRQYVENCKIKLPPLSLQQQFAKKIESIEKQKELIRKSIGEVEMLFNSRMEYYFG